MLSHLAATTFEKSATMPVVERGNRDMQELRRLLDGENHWIGLRDFWVSEGGSKFFVGETF